MSAALFATKLVKKHHRKQPYRVLFQYIYRAYFIVFIITKYYILLICICWCVVRDLCDGPIPRPEESYRVSCVSDCDHVQPPPSTPTVSRWKGARLRKKKSTAVLFITVPQYWCYELNAHWLMKRDAFFKHNTSEIRALGYSVTASRPDHALEKTGLKGDCQKMCTHILM